MFCHPKNHRVCWWKVLATFGHKVAVPCSRITFLQTCLSRHVAASQASNVTIPRKINTSCLLPGAMGKLSQRAGPPGAVRWGNCFEIKTRKIWSLQQISKRKLFLKYQWLPGSTNKKLLSQIRGCCRRLLKNPVFYLYVGTEFVYFFLRSVARSTAKRCQERNVPLSICLMKWQIWNDS